MAGHLCLGNHLTGAGKPLGWWSSDGCIAWWTVLCGEGACSSRESRPLAGQEWGLPPVHQGNLAVQVQERVQLVSHFWRPQLPAPPCPCACIHPTWWPNPGLSMWKNLSFWVLTCVLPVHPSLTGFLKQWVNPKPNHFTSCYFVL